MEKILIIISVLCLCACKPKLKPTEPKAGKVNPNNIVYIGTNDMAGYSDGALSNDGQKNSLAYLIAQQLKNIGGGEITQPLVEEFYNGFGLSNVTSTIVTAKSYLSNKADCKGVVALSPIKPNANATYANLRASLTPANYNNLSVPFAKSFHFLQPSYGTNTSYYYNPFFERFAKNKNTSSVISDAENIAPTFFVLQPALYDVLQYAMNGGAADSITNITRFETAIDNLINKLTANGANGAVINVPDVTTFPYFKTITYNGLTLDSAKVKDLTLVYNVISSGSISFSVGANPFVIYDASAPIGARQIKADEFILLNTPTDSLKCNFFGSLNPLNDRNVLTTSEINLIKTAITKFNNKLKSVCDQKNLAYVDANSFYNTLSGGIIYNGVTVNALFVKGGAFSLDGINLNPFGNALLANECIKAINKQYQSNIPHLSATNYRGVVFP